MSNPYTHVPHNNIHLGEPSADPISLNPNSNAWAAQYVLAAAEDDGSEVTVTDWLPLTAVGDNAESEIEFLESLGLLHRSDEGMWAHPMYVPPLYGPLHGPAFDIHMARILTEWTLPGRLWRLLNAQKVAESTELHQHLVREAGEVEEELYTLRKLLAAVAAPSTINSISA